MSSNIMRSENNVSAMDYCLKVLLIGDSIIKYLTHDRVFNGGVKSCTFSFPGARCTEILTCLQSGLINLSTFDVIFIHVGTNDLKNTAVEAFAKHFQIIIQTVKLQQKENQLLILSTILPRNDDLLLNKKRRGVNKILKKLKGPGITILNSDITFIRDGKAKSEFMARDGLHLSFRDGVTALSRLIRMEIRKAFPRFLPIKGPETNDCGFTAIKCKMCFICHCRGHKSQICVPYLRVKKCLWSTCKGHKRQQ